MASLRSNTGDTNIAATGMIDWQVRKEGRRLGAADDMVAEDAIAVLSDDHTGFQMQEGTIRRHQGNTTRA